MTLGAALGIEELIRVIWGTRDYVLPLPAAISGATLVGGMIYAKYRFFAAAFAIAMIGAGGSPATSPCGTPAGGPRPR